ncbi:hypothetical protein SAMN05444162_3146 [Paenibacillaceae bacterium GAS479]|nr:hypothetical protein SAMN05444162_3146 [Paenibacillaceae bacterium GAS479]
MFSIIPRNGIKEKHRFLHSERGLLFQN